MKSLFLDEGRVSVDNERFVSVTMQSDIKQNPWKCLWILEIFPANHIKPTPPPSPNQRQTQKMTLTINKRHFDCVFDVMSIIKATGDTGEAGTDFYSSTQREFDKHSHCASATCNDLWCSFFDADELDGKIPWTNVFTPKPMLIRHVRCETFDIVALFTLAPCRFLNCSAIQRLRFLHASCLRFSREEVNKIAMCFRLAGSNKCRSIYFNKSRRNNEAVQSHKLQRKLRFLTEKHKFQCSRNQNTKETRSKGERVSGHKQMRLSEHI